MKSLVSSLLPLIKLIKCHISVSDGIFIFIFGLLAHQNCPLRIFGIFSNFWIKVGLPEEACSLFMHDNSERKIVKIVISIFLIISTHKATMMATERQQRRAMPAMIPSALSAMCLQVQEEEKSNM